MAKFEVKEEKLYIDGKEVIKGWESYTGWYWFATEVAESFADDTMYFGFVQGFEEEWGYFRESELKSLGNRIWELPQKALEWSGRRRSDDEPAAKLCDCESCDCPKLPGTNEARPRICVTCGCEHL